ncbi:gamma-glutamyltransferase family protein [Burkholderia sp. 22PA0099]|uniref:gamma-glutamyltransferase family protein n=1 Tax=Burkholderia sp. 22PA0099 TaxID=3237372 RepID=UPI0039C1992D
MTFDRPDSFPMTHGMAVAPHPLAAESARSVLREGGNAVEAMIAAASTIAVVYPHMNGIGGDGFWLIARPGEAPVAIDACGAAAQAVAPQVYAEAGLSSIPHRGPLAAITVAGTVSGWQAAHAWSMQHLGGRLPLRRLLGEAIGHAADGFAASESQVRCTERKQAELRDVPGFAATFLPTELGAGARFRQPRLADTLTQLASAGFDDFYRGDLARSLAADLQAAGAPVTLDDLTRHTARMVRPLALAHSAGTVYNLPPPTQGVVSLLIVGLLDRLLHAGMDPLGPEYVHACVEATKLAFAIRDAHVTDPRFMTVDPQALLDPAHLDRLAARVRPGQAAPWGQGMGPADTVWLGAIDRDGVAVSFIQSIYHEFGSGVVLPGSGVLWQNRGCSFSLDPASRNPLMPGRLPFHTLNPALARFDDGRTLVYGTMGGDGQPQTQSAIFSRVAQLGLSPLDALDAPRWLLGRTWGESSDSLKLEARFPAATVEALRAYGHPVELLQDYDETMGHAGAILRDASGACTGGHDPRSSAGR